MTFPGRSFFYRWYHATFDRYRNGKRVMKLSLPGRVGHPGIGAAGLSIFPLSRSCERQSRGSADNHTWIDAARTRETRCAYPRGHALIRNHCATPHRQSNPDEPRISYAIARISPSNVRTIRAGGSNRGDRRAFSREKKKYRNATWIRWWGKREKKQNGNQRENAFRETSANLTFKFHAPTRQILVSKREEMEILDSKQRLRISDFF